jgi:cytoskeletal protein RodZ
MSEKDKNKDTEQKNGNGRSPQVGALLRASRLRVGEDLRDVSDILCIRYLYLEAIEECRYADLPGNTYAVGFIRSYAEHLGLDGDEVVRRYRVEQTGGKSATDLAFPTPVQDSGVPKGAIVFIGVLIALLVYGGWYVTTTDESILSDLISPVPDHLKQLVAGEDLPGDASQSASNAPPVETTRDETPPVAATEAATKEIEDVVRETTAAAQQMASDAGAAAQRNAEAAAEAVTPVDEATVESTNQTVATAAEPAQNASETTAETVNETTQPVAAVVSETLPPPTSSPVEAEPEVSRAEPAAAPQQTTASETPTAQVSRPATPAAETSAAAPSASTPATADPAQTSADVTASAVEQTAVPAPETAETEAQPAERENSSTGPATAAAPEVAATTTAPETAANAPASGASAEVTAEDLNALVLRQATGVSGQVTAPSPPQSAARTSGETASTSGVAISATSSSWVEIRNPANGDIVFTGLMSAGSVFNVPDTDGLTLDTGNAGALDITVDGTAVPKIGGVGAVRKNVSLDADRLKAGTATNR